MKGFFDPCVDDVIELIQGQLGQIERIGRRLRVGEHSAQRRQVLRLIT